jgi:hypothetical protein
MRFAAPALVLAAALLGGCTSTQRCSANADCPVQSACLIDDGGLSGTCHQACAFTADCPAGLRCSALGQCVPLDLGGDSGLAPDAAPADAPADAAPADAALPDAVGD